MLRRITNLGLALIQKNQKDEARNEFEKARELDPALKAPANQ